MTSHISPPAKWFSNLLLRIQGCQDLNICERCSKIFNTTVSAETERQTSSERPLSRSRPLEFDCISRLRWKETCPLCKEVFRRLNHVPACQCLSAADFCIALEEIRGGRGHDYEWRINYEGARRGSVVRNSRVKLKKSNFDPRMIWDDTVVSANMIQNLLGRCGDDHPDCERPAALRYIRYNASGQLPGSSPKIYLTDVEHDCIVESSIRKSYVALSYVWGGITQTTALCSNIEALKRRGALRSPNFAPPRLIKDAISLVYSIGIRYLWVDSLCIVQDDPGKHSMLASMDRIYSFARITLVALDSVSANDSLPGVRRSSRSHLHPHVKTSKDWFHTGPNDNLDIHISNSKYSTRAWTFQECFMSTRVLYFTNSQVYFRCRAGVWAETSPDVNLGVECDTYTRMWNTLGYKQLISEYSGKQLSYDDDILNAFDGIESFLTCALGWQFVDGVLLCEVPHGLLYFYETGGYRRLGKKGRPFLPSWSWAGKKGRVTWRVGEGAVWKEFADCKVFNPGTSRLMDMTMFMTEETLIKLKAQESRGPLQTTSAEKAHAALLIESLHSAGLLFDTENPTTLLRFVARTIPASSLQYLVYHHHRLSTDEEHNTIYSISHGGRRVGLLFCDGKLKPQRGGFRFVQITECGALVIGPSWNDHHDERVGVAFFKNAEFFKQYPLSQIVLA